MMQSYWLITLIGPKALDEGPKWEIGKLKLKLHGIVLERKSISLGQKTRAKRKLLVWRTKMDAWGTIQIKDLICSKWIQVGS
jgi:hypothetical protein